MNRRSLAGAVAALVLSGSTANASERRAGAKFHADAALLALAPPLRATLAETSATELSDGTVPPGVSDADYDSWLSRVGEDLEAICEQIVDAPAAQTAEGLALKAAAAMHQLRLSYHGGWPGSGEWLAWDVLSEIAGEAYVPISAAEYARNNCEPGRTRA